MRSQFNDVERRRREAETLFMSEWCCLLSSDRNQKKFYHRLFEGGIERGEIKPFKHNKILKGCLLTRESVRDFLMAHGHRPHWMWSKTMKKALPKAKIITALEEELRAGRNRSEAIEGVRSKLNVSRERVREVYKRVDPALRPQRGRPKNLGGN